MLLPCIGGAMKAALQCHSMEDPLATQDLHRLPPPLRTTPRLQTHAPPPPAPTQQTLPSHSADPLAVYLRRLPPLRTTPRKPPTHAPLPPPTPCAQQAPPSHSGALVSLATRSHSTTYDEEESGTTSPAASDPNFAFAFSPSPIHYCDATIRTGASPGSPAMITTPSPRDAAPPHFAESSPPSNEAAHTVW